MSNSSSILIKSYYDYLMVDLADPRTNDWLLVKDPLSPLLVIALYLYFVLVWGPNFMKYRKPFEFKYTLIFYNLFQVLLSSWMFYESIDGAWGGTYSWICEPVDRSLSPHAMRVARGVYIFYLAKFSELFDTVFFVLRKKDNQVSFLHLYHHSMMPLVAWAAVKYFPGGHGIFIGFINSFVHIIMYFYYMVAAMGSQFQKYLWWKKYLTTIQLAQFCIGFIHNSQLLFYDCGFPRWTVVITLPNAIFFYYLFSDFYNKAYKDEKKISNGNVTMTNGIKLKKLNGNANLVIGNRSHHFKNE